jgi:F-type H+-transporting ATPase subunit b
MEIHWDIFITHSFGFLITLWILKKYAWGPLLGLLDERRNKIIDEFQKIEDDRSEVEKLTAEYEAKLRDIESERRVALTEAINEGKTIASEIKSKAQSDAKAEAEKKHAELQRDVAKAKVQLKNDMVNMTMTAAGRIIKEEMDDDKHRQLISAYIDDVEKVK